MILSKKSATFREHALKCPNTAELTRPCGAAELAPDRALDGAKLSSSGRGAIADQVSARVTASRITTRNPASL
jgi:hypothetical protein